MATYYVKNGGSDAADGLSDGNAWETLAKVNGESFSPGDTICFKKGSTFAGALVVTWAGSSGSYITFTNYGTGALPIIDPTDWYAIGNYGQSSKDYIIIDGLDLYGCTVDAGRPMSIHNADHWIIRNCVMRSSIGGLWFESCTDFDIYDNIIHDCGTTNFDAMWMTGAGGDDFDVHHNEIYNCHGNGIAFEDVANSLIHHNYIHDNDFETAYAGLGVESNCDNVKVYHNLLHDNDDGFCIIINSGGHEIYNNTCWGNGTPVTYAIHLIDWEGDTPIDNIIKNNIFYTPDGKEIIRIASAGNGTAFDEMDNIWDHNILYGAGASSHVVTTEDSGDFTWAEWQAEGFEAHGQHTDPLLMNVSGDDYHLKSNSPAIDAGTDVGLLTDLDGIPIGRGTAPDVGCYETLKGGPRRL
jgi:hypothetical protein